jgi:hypothetical protein
MLGLTVIEQRAGRAVLSCGAAHLTLTVDRIRQPGRGELLYLILTVEDVEAAYRTLRSQEVPFVHGPLLVSWSDGLEMWSAACHDPDGHGIALTKWIPAP